MLNKNYRSDVNGEHGWNVTARRPIWTKCTQAYRMEDYFGMRNFLNISKRFSFSLTVTGRSDRLWFIDEFHYYCNISLVIPRSMDTATQYPAFIRPLCFSIAPYFPMSDVISTQRLISLWSTPFRPDDAFPDDWFIPAISLVDSNTPRRDGSCLND